MKLTATQTELLKYAARNRDGIGGFQRGYWTGGRKGSFGSRASRAYEGLLRAGLATHRDSYRSIFYGKWRCADCHSTDVSFYITDAGRAAIAA